MTEAARDVVEWFEDLASSLSVGDWVLVALAGAALYWIYASLKASTRLGPIEVQTLEHDGAVESGPTVKAYTAQLRERLMLSGLSPPPAVPAGRPQADLIDAVEASTIPQGAWIAKLLELLPQPPKPREYRISGVLIDRPSDDAGILREYDISGAPVATKPKTRGLSFWIRPSSEGAAELKTVHGFQDHGEAVDAAASLIYLHVSNDAQGAFPRWARWHRKESLEAYLAGCRLRTAGEVERAFRSLEQARKAEPFNALAALQVANLYEQSVPPPVSNLWMRRAEVQAEALRRYLDIADDWRDLVEARYRASVIAGALASTLAHVDDAERGEIADYLQLPIVDGPAALEDQLRLLAARECTAVLQLLRAWYALAKEFRLRTPFEPKAHARRVLRHTVAISKHCHRMRAICENSPRWWWIEIRYRSLAVDRYHVFVPRGTLDWQGFYNAACFDALLLKYLRIRRGAAATSGTSPTPPSLPSAWEGRVERRALERLREAFSQAGDQLRPAWVARDPDQDVFLKWKTPTPAADLDELLDGANPKWVELLERPDARLGQLLPPTWGPPRPPSDLQPVRLPRRPWPTLPRLIGWFLAIPLALAAIVAAIVFSDIAWEILVPAAVAAFVFIGYRLWLAWSERRLVSTS